MPAVRFMRCIQKYDVYADHVRLIYQDIELLQDGDAETREQKIVGRHVAYVKCTKLTVSVTVQRRSVRRLFELVCRDLPYFLPPFA